VRVTLLHNAEAGDEDHDAEALRSLIAEAGHRVAYRSLKETGWEAALDNPGDLVVLAGGDGSIGKVMRKVARVPAPVTLLPLGSANNIARTVGIADARLDELVRGWETGEQRRFDIGEVSAPWGDSLFVESVGGGIFGDVLERAEEIDADEADGEEKVRLGLELMREIVESAPALAWEVVVDGIDLSGDYLAVEAMNIRELGPNFPVAPDADPGDGLLDVVLIQGRHRSALARYFEERLAGEEPRPHELPARRGERVMLRPPAECLLHVDDGFWPDDPEARGDGSAVATTGPSVTLLVPRPRL
jgi:diacylglycerol kinase (ATP)